MAKFVPASVPSSFASGDVIVAQATNPHRLGTLSHSEFSIYKPNMTVAQFIEKGGKLKDLRFHIAHRNCTMDTEAASKAAAKKAERAAAKAQTNLVKTEQPIQPTTDLMADLKASLTS
jgi:hypothetical protein